jgi:hypothetical protein
MPNRQAAAIVAVFPSALRENPKGSRRVTTAAPGTATSGKVSVVLNYTRGYPTPGPCFALVVTDYEVKKRKSAGKLAERRKKHLGPFFAHRPAAMVTTETVAQYIASRQQAKKRPVKDATINRELAILSRAYKLGRKARLVDQAPTIEKLPERNVRTGFFPRPQLEAVCAHLKASLIPFFVLPIPLPHRLAQRRGEGAAVAAGRRRRTDDQARRRQHQERRGQGDPLHQ